MEDRTIRPDSALLWSSTSRGGDAIPQLDLSRAIRADLARHIDARRDATVSYSVPSDLIVDVADADAARLAVHELIGFLLDAADHGGGLLSVVKPAAPGPRGLASLVWTNASNDDGLSVVLALPA